MPLIANAILRGLDKGRLFDVLLWTFPAHGWYGSVGR